jgi:hypothetical protein
MQQPCRISAFNIENHKVNIEISPEDYPFSLNLETRRVSFYYDADANPLLISSHLKGDPSVTKLKFIRLLLVALAISVGLGARLTSPHVVLAQSAPCDSTTTCFDVSLSAGLVGDFYLDDALVAAGVGSARLTGAPGTPFVVGARNIQEPGGVGFGDLYLYPDQSQANVQGLAGQVRFIGFRPIKNYVKGILNYTCNPRGFKVTDSVACRPTIDGAPQADVAPGAMVSYNLPPGDHALHTDLVGDSANNWSATARDDVVTVNAGTPFPQITRLSAEFVLKGLLQISLWPANLLADLYVDGVSVASQSNAINVFVVANVAHTVEARNIQDPGTAGFNDLFVYLDQSNANALARAAQTRLITFRPARNYVKGVLNYVCDPRGFKATDSAACRPTLDGAPQADVAPGATVSYNLEPGAHTLHTDLVGDSANNWSPIIRDDAPTINAGKNYLQTTTLRATFQLKALLKLSLSPTSIVADLFVNDVQVGTQVSAVDVYVAAGTYTVQAKNVTDAAANGVYRYDDKAAPATTVAASQTRIVLLAPKKIFLQGYLNFTCRINGLLAGDDVRCGMSVDGQSIGAVEAGQTQKFTLATGAHAINVRLSGRNAALWAPFSVDSNVNTLGGGTGALFLAFDAKGRQLMARGLYQEAMALYLNVKATSQDPDVLAGADLGYQEALVALANASNGQGAAIIQNAINAACAGQPAGSPAINLFKDQQGKSRVCGNSFTLPSDLSATIPGHFRYVIIKETGTDEVEHCDYTGGHSMVRVENWMKLKLVSTETGQVVNENTFRGSGAPECPYFHMFFSITDYLYGDQPSLDDAINWLRTIQ